MISRVCGTFAIVSLALTSAGCYHHILMTYGNPGMVSNWHKTVNAGWGSNGATVPAPGVPNGTCNNSIDRNGMNLVTVDSNIGYAALIVVTLGSVSPARVNWKCAPNPSVVGPSPSAARVSPPAPSAGPAPSTKSPSETPRTLTSEVWGLLQSDAKAPSNPPPGGAAPAGPPTPANCNAYGMSQVKIHSFTLNYLYAVATVATIGFVSPMRVAWQCVQPANGSTAGSAPAKEKENVSR
jgi:hypothetical protein